MSDVTETTVIDTDKVVFRDDLYPRIRTSAETVQKYAEDLSVLPPIEVNQHYELIDGWHRWTAHRKNEEAQIGVVVTQTRNEAHLLELAIERNASHGLQLSQEDKAKMGKRLYRAALDDGRVKTTEQRAEMKKYIAKILSVTVETAQDWTSRTDKDDKAEREQRIFDMWLACYTQQEIGDAVGLSRETIKDWEKDFGEKRDSPETTKITAAQRAAAEHATDFDAPIYNVWKWQTKSEGSSHFGNSDSRIVDNLLWMYTSPFDVVADPFAGGGSTIDICRKRLRRYWVSDRKPIIEREKEIRQHDLTDGLPRLPWKDTRLVYLDPPYWVQAAGEYSDDPTDLGNMDLDTFHVQLAKIVNAYLGKLSDGAHVALIIQPTQWKAPDRQFTDHVAAMIKAVKRAPSMRISCPYESQQCNAQMVEWAKENRTPLVLTREVVVWRA